MIKNITEFLADLNSQLKEIEFNSCDVLLLNSILVSKDKGKYGKVISLNMLKKDCLSSIRTLSRYLKKLANYGLINVYHQYDQSDLVRTSSEIIVSHVLKLVASQELRGTERQRQLIRLANLGTYRYEVFQGDDMQGFTSHVHYGEVEIMRKLTPELVAKLPAQERSLFSIVYQEVKKQTEHEERKARTRERLEKARLANAFVKGCAQLWMKAQCQYGRMSIDKPIMPVWYSEEPRGLPSTAKKEYDELARAFLKYGGQKLGAAWLSICARETDLKDEFGKPKFDRERPHLLMSPDRKPSQFIKNLTSIFIDPTVEAYATQNGRIELEAHFPVDVLNYQGEDDPAAEIKITKRDSQDVG